MISSIAWVNVCVKSEKKHEGGMGDFFLAQGAPLHLSPLFSPDLCLLHHLGRVHMSEKSVFIMKILRTFFCLSVNTLTTPQGLNH